MQTVGADVSGEEMGLMLRKGELFEESSGDIHRRADRLFANLLIVQWLAGIAAAVWISPRTWIGATSHIHWHVWAAVFLGGAITSLPVFLAWKQPGQTLTRHVIAVAQMLSSALLIHLTGGRIETHFHVFGSLAFMAFYRDWRVLMTATVVVAVDHMARGLFWPQSVFGVLASSPWRWVEHAGWVLFEDIFLFISIRHSLRDMEDVALRRAKLEVVNAGIEIQVSDRTAELTAAHQKLQANEARLRLILETVPECVKLVAADGTLFDMNPAGLAMIEVDKLEQVAGKPVCDLLPEKYRPLFRALTAGVFRGESGTLEYEIVGRNGTHRWLEAHACPMRDAAGRIIAQLVVTRDISERRRSQEELQKKGRFAKAVLNSLTANIAVLDDQANIIAVNQAWENFARENGDPEFAHTGIGVNYLETLRRASGEWSGEALHALVGIQAVLDGSLKEFTLEYPCHSPAEKRWFMLYVTPLANEREGAVVTHINITARKLAEEQMRASLKEISDLKYALDASAIVAVTDQRGIITSANDKFCAISKYSREELIGQDHRIINSGHHPKEFFRNLWATVARGRTWRGEICNRAKDGSVYWVDTTIVPFLSNAGKPFQYVVIRADITERKQAEANLEQVHKDLLQTSRMAGMAEVATGVLHNVGNVLNSVNVSATLVAEKIKRSKSGNVARVATLLREHEADLAAFITADERGKQLPSFLNTLAEHLVTEQAALLVELASLQKNIEHIKDVVSMQQTYAKVSGVTETVQIEELIEDTLRMNAASLMRHELRVVREFSAVPPIVVDKHKLLQILVNLVRNAKHACDDAGRDDKQITLRLMGDSEYVRVSVADNGIGIPPENLTRIFNHGFTTKKDGHGFGLHSGANAAKEMGGSLTVHSAGRGHGAVFTLELPLKPKCDAHD